MNHKYCFLCLSECFQSVLLTVKIQDDYVYEILAAHFWFEFNDETKRNSICSDCLSKITAFHGFYREIQTIHRKSETVIQEISIETVDIKIECEKEMEGDDSTDDDSNQSINEPSPDESKSRKSVKRQSKGTRIKSMKKEVDECNKRDKSRRFLTDNRTNFIQHFSMECELCSKPFDSLTDAHTHFRQIHKRKGYLLCCGQRFFNHRPIVLHLKKHIQSDELNKAISDGQSFREHKIDSLTKKRIYKCEQCNRSFTRPHTLKVHLLSQHSNVDKKFECIDCSKRFLTEKFLRLHLLRVHENGTSRICDICAKIFKSVASYKLHYQIVHTNEMQRIQCNICGVWVKHVDTLRSHVDRMHNSKPQTCTHCGKISPNIKALRSHIKFNHTIKHYYSCPVCEKAFKRAKVLKEHMAIHTGVKDLYKCTFCSKTFRSNANMYSHRKRDHPTEYSKLIKERYEKTVDDKSSIS